MKPLFAYGTFVRRDWRTALLGADYAAEPATLHGWERVACESGYLSLREAKGARVDGVLVALDAIGWAIADHWEEVPKYRRADVVARTARGPADASAYVAANAAGARTIADAGTFAVVSDAEVEASIARFAVTMRRLRDALAASGPRAD